MFMFKGLGTQTWGASTVDWTLTNSDQKCSPYTN